MHMQSFENVPLTVSAAVKYEVNYNVLDDDDAHAVDVTDLHTYLPAS